VGATYLLTLVGLDEWADNTFAVTAVAVALLAGVTVIAYRGIQVAAVVQYALLGLQLAALAGFGAAALLRHGVLLCLFIYWGWDALITVNEETRDRDRTPGKAAVKSTLVLLGTYLFTAFAAISFAGTGTDGPGLGNPDNAADILATLGSPVFGGALAKVLQLAICVSAIAALLTCVIGSPRTTLSMGSHGALPRAFTRILPVFRTPSFGTVSFGTAATALLTVLTVVSANFLSDAILSIGLLIAFYYGITSLSCVWYFRRLSGSVRDALLKGVLPLLGALMMLAAFARSAMDMIKPDYGITSFDGVGGVFLLGVGSIILGVVVMLVLRPRFRQFFRTGRETVAGSTITSE
jgi:amino acid transporter